MSIDEGYEYLARVSEPSNETIDRPSGLWRRRGDELESFSTVDLTWHPRGPYVPHPDLLVPISTEQVQILINDRERFARYWVWHQSPEKGDFEEDTTVYRKLYNPGGDIDEGFGRNNAWVRTPDIRDFLPPAPTTTPTSNPSTAKPPNASSRKPAESPEPPNSSAPADTTHAVMQTKAIQMSIDEGYEYLAQVSKASDESVDRPSGLWRRRGNELEFFSTVDLTWHPRGPYVPHSDLLVAISTEQVRILINDRERFARYWVWHQSPEKGDFEENTTVYRKLFNPGGDIDEGFAQNTWVRTRAIREFRAAGPHDHPDLEPIDRQTAERIIKETRGITGATEL